MREPGAYLNSFARRHIGPNQEEVDAMLGSVGLENLNALIEAAIPKNIRLNRQLDLPEAKSESEALTELRAIAKKNRVTRSFIGAGYYDCITPPVIQRNILENPGWYTAYTPYQGDRARPPRGAAQFPTDDHRPNSARYRKRIAARRSYCRRRSDVALSRSRSKTEDFFCRR